MEDPRDRFQKVHTLHQIISENRKSATHTTDYLEEILKLMTVRQIQDQLGVGKSQAVALQENVKRPMNIDLKKILDFLEFTGVIKQSD